MMLQVCSSAITKVDSGFAVVSGLLGSVEVDVKSFATNWTGLLIDLAKAKIEAMMVPARACSLDEQVRTGRGKQSSRFAGKGQDYNEIIVSGDGIIRVGINGKIAALRIDPAAPGIPLYKTVRNESRCKDEARGC